MWGLPIILSLFRNKLDKLNNIGAWILDSKNHMALKFLTNLCVQNGFLCYIFAINNLLTNDFVLDENNAHFI